MRSRVWEKCVSFICGGTCFHPTVERAVGIQDLPSLRSSPLQSNGLHDFSGLRSSPLQSNGLHGFSGLRFSPLQSNYFFWISTIFREKIFLSFDSSERGQAALWLLFHSRYFIY